MLKFFPCSISFSRNIDASRASALDLKPPLDTAFCFPFS
nr:MAG TPA: hypothetical protein [Caudoviricetes sp.]